MQRAIVKAGGKPAKGHAQNELGTPDSLPRRVVKSDDLLISPFKVTCQAREGLAGPVGVTSWVCSCADSGNAYVWWNAPD